MLLRIVYLIFILVILLAVICCTDKGTEPADSNHPDSPGDTIPQIISITGITETSLDNQILASDSNDWCYQVPTPDASVLQEFALYPVYPNPSYQQVMIKYDLPETAAVSLTVIDSFSTVVKKLVDTSNPPGRHWTTWDRSNASGTEVPLGMYRLVMKAGDFSCYGDICLIAPNDLDSNQVVISASIAGNTLNIYYQSEIPLGGLFLILIADGTAGPPQFHIVARNMTKDYSYLDNTLRIIIVPPLFPSGPTLPYLPAGTHLLCSVPFEKSLIIGYADATDVEATGVLRTRIVNP